MAAFILAAGSRPHRSPLRSSSELAANRFEKMPWLLTELALPLRVEAGLTQHLAKWLRIDVIENQPLGREISLEAFVLFGDVFALR